MNQSVTSVLLNTGATFTVLSERTLQQKKKTMRKTLQIDGAEKCTYARHDGHVDILIIALPIHIHSTS